MSWHWKDLLPVDRYMVRTVDYLTDLDEKVLTLLYQPLIGALSYSLYMTLWRQLKKEVYWSEEFTHRHLMTLMDVPLNELFVARKKLEGIGLLKTYQKKDEELSLYLYELQPPISPQQFFTDDVLSVYLYNRLGKRAYRETRDRFLIEKVDKDKFIEITRSFDEVFTSLHHSEIVISHQSEQADATQIPENQEIFHRHETRGIDFSDDFFDFELFRTSLSTFIAPQKLLTDEVRKTITRLAFVYRIDPLEMSRIVQQTVIHEDEINLQDLRKRVQEWYKIEHGHEPPSLGLQKQPNRYRVMANKTPQTEEEKMIHYFETVSPIELLESRSDGGKVPPPDVKIIEELILDYELLPGVANVLLDYVLQRNDMKLSKPLIDKIAGHWKRKNIKTVPDAMALAKEEHRRSLEFQEKKAKQPKLDKLPDWLMEDS